jgi:hypothetical protein
MLIASLPISGSSGLTGRYTNWFSGAGRMESIGRQTRLSFGRADGFLVLASAVMVGPLPRGIVLSLTLSSVVNVRSQDPAAATDRLL